MTPPPDPVAALRDVFWSDEAEAPNDPAEMYRHLTAAGWNLSRRSEREALVELAALVSEVYAHVGPDGQHLPESDKHVQIWVHTSTRDRMGDLYAKHVDAIRAAIEGRP